jgi:hypothetical protein
MVSSTATETLRQLVMFAVGKVVEEDRPMLLVKLIDNSSGRVDTSSALSRSAIFEDFG